MTRHLFPSILILFTILTLILVLNACGEKRKKISTESNLTSKAEPKKQQLQPARQAQRSHDPSPVVAPINKEKPKPQIPETVINAEIAPQLETEIEEEKEEVEAKKPSPQPSIPITPIYPEPQVMSSPALNATTSQAYSYQIELAETDDYETEFKIINAPAGMKVNEKGLVEWLVPGNIKGDVPIQIKAFQMGNEENFVLHNFSILVEQTISTLEDGAYPCGSINNILSVSLRTGEIKCLDGRTLEQKASNVSYTGVAPHCPEHKSSIEEYPLCQGRSVYNSVCSHNGASRYLAVGQAVYNFNNYLIKTPSQMASNASGGEVKECGWGKRNGCTGIGSNCDGGLQADVAGNLIVGKENIPLGSAPWQDAHNYCQNLNENGYSDWELPTISQLKIVMDNINKLNPDSFNQYFYWAKTPYPNVSNAYYVIPKVPDSSGINYRMSDYKCFARCVRTP